MKRNKLIKYLLTIFITINLFTSSFVVNVFGESNKYNFNSNNISNYSGEKNTTFSFHSLLSDYNRKYSLNYDDRWFIDNYSYLYNQDIANFLMKTSFASGEGYGDGD